MQEFTHDLFVQDIETWLHQLVATDQPVLYKVFVYARLCGRTQIPNQFFLEHICNRYNNSVQISFQQQTLVYTFLVTFEPRIHYETLI